MRRLMLCFACAAAVVLITGAAHAQTQKAIVQMGMRLETHTDRDSSDDYVMNVVSITQHLERNIAGSIYYLYKFNLDRGSTGGHAVGANLIQMFSAKNFATLGYSYTMNEKNSNLTSETSRDRFRLGYYHKLHETERGNRVLGFLAYNTQTDWSESRTIDVGVAYKQPVTPHWTANTTFKYTQGLGAMDTHLYDQYQFDFSYKLCDDTDLSLGYLFVDKQFTTPAGDPDDDDVFRMSVMRRYK